MRKKKVTMKDIATAAGVSQPTVSIILNGSDSVKIAKETRQRVLAIARELGYELRRQVPHTSYHKKIAFMVNSLNMHDPFINALSAAREAAWEQDCLLVVFDYEEEGDLHQALEAEITNGDYSALIYARNITKQVPPPAFASSLPTVMLNCYPPRDSAIVSILPADLIGGYTVTEHLIRQGYRRIAMITGEPWAEPSKSREEGYRQALINHDLLPDNNLVRRGNWSVKQSYLQTLALLEKTPRPEAIFCASDLMAVGCYQAIARKGMRIPEDIAVAGYDNQLLANELTPALTTIDLPYDDMGRLAVDVITGRAREAELPMVKVEGALYERRSSQRIDA